MADREQRQLVWNLSLVIRECLRLSSNAVPLQSLHEWPFLLQNMSRAFTWGGSEFDNQFGVDMKIGAVDAARYRIVGAEQPQWLSMDWATGRVSVQDVVALQVCVQSGQATTIRVELDREIPIPPNKSEIDVMEVTLDPNVSAQVGMEQHTLTVLAAVLALPGPPSVHGILEGILCQIYDYGKGQCIPHAEFGLCVEVLSDALRLTWAVATGKLLV